MIKLQIARLFTPAGAHRAFPSASTEYFDQRVGMHAAGILRIQQENDSRENGLVVGSFSLNTSR